MFLPGADAQGMTHRQCLELLEGVEDTLDFLTATLTYLIHAESQQSLPDAALIAAWETLQQEVFDVEQALPGADVTVYQQALLIYGTVIYKTASKLYEELQIAIGDGSLPKYRTTLSRAHLLILDDFGLAPVEPTVGYTLLDIVDQRMQHGSLIITSQFPTEHWHSMFSDATLAEAILDRIVHRSHRIALKGESLRKQAVKV